MTSIFNRTGSNNLLKTSLKQEIDVRFDSKCLLSQSILNNFNHLKLITNDQVKGVERYISIMEDNFSLFKAFAGFLKEFYECRLSLSSKTTSSINLVLFNYLKLEKHCRPVDSRLSKIKFN